MKTRGEYAINAFKYPGGSTAYRVTGTQMDGVRIRENYKTQPEALARKQQLEIEVLNFVPEKRITTTRLTPAQEAEAEHCFAELDGRSMTLAIRFFKENYREPLLKITVGDAYPLFLADKKNSGLRDASLQGLKTRVGFLVRKFSDKLVSDIQPAHVAEAAAQPGVTESTREDNRRSFSSFFSWSMEKRYCVTNPAKKTIRRRGHGTRDDVEPAIMNLDEVRRLLAVAADYKGAKLIPYVSLALFAAIRPTELARITWDNIDLEGGTITIGAKMAKMRQRRIVEMASLTERVEKIEMAKQAKKGKKGKLIKETTTTTNLIDWLKPHAVNKTPICGANWRKDFDAVKLAAGFGNPDHKPAAEETQEAKLQRHALKPWTPDILRHTGISNHLAFFKHEGKSAAWAGNSPDIIQRHYKGLVKHCDAKEFWMLNPNSKKTKASNRI
jgi:integrase